MFNITLLFNVRSAVQA